MLHVTGYGVKVKCAYDLEIGWWIRVNQVKVSFVFFFILVLCCSSSLTRVWAWSNGGYTDPGNAPWFGTHDWIALHAAEWLPSDERWWIERNVDSYLLGTELPDNAGHPLGIGDAALHHVYYSSSHVLTDASAANRAQTEYNAALAFLKVGNYSFAALHAGIMSHYIADVAVFAHVMGSSTDWGAETHHSDYESAVDTRTDEYPTDDFSAFVSFDGVLSTLSAYNATIQIAYNTTFGGGLGLSCVWMDTHYNWSDPTFVSRSGESVSLATNCLADVLHSLNSEANPNAVLACFGATFGCKPSNTVYFVPTGNIYDDSTLYAFYAFKENPQVIAAPTQSPASDSILDVDGKPLFTENIITFGGRVANRLVHYYEDAGIARVAFLNNGTHYVFANVSNGVPLYAVNKATYNAANKDYFVIQTYKDSGRYVLSEWGISAEGTYAGGVCFIDIITPNIGNYQNQYYIYSWTDLNYDGKPQQNEIVLEVTGN